MITTIITNESKASNEQVIQFMTQCAIEEPGLHYLNVTDGWGSMGIFSDRKTLAQCEEDGRPPNVIVQILASTQQPKPTKSTMRILIMLNLIIWSLAIIFWMLGYNLNNQ